MTTKVFLSLLFLVYLQVGLFKGMYTLNQYVTMRLNLILAVMDLLIRLKHLFLGLKWFHIFLKRMLLIMLEMLEFGIFDHTKHKVHQNMSLQKLTRILSEDNDLIWEGKRGNGLIGKWIIEYDKKLQLTLLKHAHNHQNLT